MINRLLMAFVKACLALRYRIRVIGLKTIARPGREGILFLPNHVALIDPIIMMSLLWGRFAPRPVADPDEVDMFFVRWMAKRAGAIEIPAVERYGLAGQRRIDEGLSEAARTLRRGGNVLIYPAGRLCTSRFEDLGASSAVETILRDCGDARVVLVRMRGLWGSAFGWASGCEPFAGKALKKGIRGLLAGGVLFAPKRRVTVEFVEPDDLPRTADRDTVNRYLEAFYNRDPEHNTRVPYTFWRGLRPRRMPEPRLRARIEGDVSDVPASIRQAVREYLADLTASDGVTPESRLAHDLGLDSLARADLAVWLEKEFGLTTGDPESLATVGDVMLAAAGKAITKGPAEIEPPSDAWFAEPPEDRRLDPPEGRTIAHSFLARARGAPDKVIIADQASGAKTYRDIVLGIMALKGPIEKLPGRRVGIMLPASVAADIVYLAVMFAGKTPVMVNWTVGPRNIRHGLDLAGVERILTARALIDRLEAQGVELGDALPKTVCLEDISRGLGLITKLRCRLASRLSWKSLENADISPTAVILFTSGSESLPKAVPLSHANLLANLTDIIRSVGITTTDRLIGILPPFHSFGLSGCVLTAMSLGARTVYHPNPTEAEAIGRIVETYRVTVLLGTPTFLGGIARAAAREQLAPLRLAVTGAEKCSRRVYELLRARCPGAVILEGYGVTECSPFISLNDENDPKPGTIGKVLPSLQYAVVDEQITRRLERGRRGMLIVRGPSVFDGYLDHDGDSPFVEFEGKQWYRTGDLVTEDDDGVLTFAGRLKRFVKLGGEMISLPAIEAVLMPLYATGEEDRPVLAVTAQTDQDPPELVLFTTFDGGRAEINEQIRDAGLSPLHTIRRVIRVEEIPVLGTGKTDYRALGEMLPEAS